MSFTLEDIIKEKEAGNNFLKKGDFVNAEKSYKETISKIEQLPTETKNDKDIKTQTTFIYSNLAHALLKQNKLKESMDYDRKIIKRLDEHFSKSYARLVDGYLKLNNVTMARYHYDLMIKNIPQEDFVKFPEITKKITEALGKHDEQANAFLALRDLFAQK